MAHDIFIAYAADDKRVAEAVCAALESKHIRCWLAPRDVLPGMKWVEAIVDAIDESRLFILVLSASSNSSPQVIREVGRAVSKSIPIIPLRIDDTPLSKEMEFFISRHQWLDAQTPPLEKHLHLLTGMVQRLLAQEAAARTKKEADEAAREKASQEIEAARDKARREAEEAKRAEEAEARAKKEAEQAAKEKASQEIEVARNKARREAEEAKKAEEAEARAKKEAEQAAKEKARLEAEAARDKARREAEEAEARARKEAEQAAKEKARQETKARERAKREAEAALKAAVRKITRPRWFWTGVALLSAGLGWQIFWAAIPAWGPGPREWADLYKLMLAVLAGMVLGACCLWRGLAQSRLTGHGWLRAGRAFLSVGLGLPLILLILLSVVGVGGVERRALDERFIFPIVLGSGLPFITLGIYCLRQAARKITKSRWLGMGVALLSVGLELQIFLAAAVFSKPLETPLAQFYELMLAVLLFIILGACCSWRGLAQSRLSRPLWLQSWRVLITVGLGLPFMLFLLLGWDGRALDMHFVIPIVLGSALPFIVLGGYCLRRGWAEGRLAKPVVEKEKPPVPVERPARPVWFRVGLLLFVLALGFGWAILVALLSSGGSYPDISASIFSISISIPIVLSVLLIKLSRKKLRHGWFWPGVTLFVYGLAAAPQWVNIYPEVGHYPKAFHNPGELALAVGAFCVPNIIGGAFCLWRGWLRSRDKHSRREPLSFILTLSAISLALTLTIAANAGPVERDILSFSDNFEDGNANGWKLSTGWQVVKDNGSYVLEGQGQDYQWAWPQVNQASAYVLEADFMLLNGSLRFNTMYAQTPPRAPDRYAVELSESYIQVGKESVHDSTRDWVVLDKCETNVTLKQWHHIKIAVGGGTVRVYLDGALKIERWDEKPLASGSFAIETCQNSHAYVDNIVVKPYTAPAPAPETPLPTTKPAPPASPTPTVTPAKPTTISSPTPTVAPKLPDKLTWKISLPVAQGVSTRPIEDWAEDISAATNGRWQIEISYDGQLASADKTLEGLKSGAFQGAWVSSMYHPDKTPLMTVMQNPFLSPSDIIQQSEWLMAVAQHPAIVKELSGWNARILFPASFPPYNFMGRVPLQKAEDFTGKKIRISPGRGAEALQTLGAVPATIPMAELYTALDRGIIDAVCLPWSSAFGDYGLHEVAKYATIGVDLMVVDAYIAVNTAAWDALPAEWQELCQDSATKAAARYAKYYAEEDAKWVPIFKQAGIAFFNFPPEERAKLVVKAASVWEAWVQDMEGKGLPGRDVLSFAQKKGKID